MLQVSQDVEDTSPLSAPHLWNTPLGSIVALATLNGVFVPEFYLKPGQQPVLYRDKDQSLRAYQYYDTDRRNVRYADDAVLRVRVTELHERFPDLQSRFTAVYIAVWDPGRRLWGPFSPAENLSQHFLNIVYTSWPPASVLNQKFIEL